MSHLLDWESWAARMASQLVHNNVSLTVFNRSAAPMKLLEEQGAKKASNPVKDAVSDAEVVFSMLPSPEMDEEVITGRDGGPADGDEQGALWVDCSTVNPSFSISLHRLAENHQLRFLDIPVAGTKTHAEQADLTFLAGGMAEDLEKVEPLLKYMGKKDCARRAGRRGKFAENAGQQPAGPGNGHFRRNPGTG